MNAKKTLYSMSYDKAANHTERLSTFDTDQQEQNNPKNAMCEWLQCDSWLLNRRCELRHVLRMKIVSHFMHRDPSHSLP